MDFKKWGGNLHILWLKNGFNILNAVKQWFEWI